METKNKFNPQLDQYAERKKKITIVLLAWSVN